MNTLKEHCPFHIEGKRERGYTITIGHDRIRVINVFIGTKSASEAIYDTAIKKILYDSKDNL